MKIIINEWQFLVSKGLITEEKYQDALKKLKVGDKLEYTDDKGGKLTFSVVFNDSGQVYLKNDDAGIYKNNYFFISVSDLSKTDLTFRTINFVKNLPDKLKGETDDSVKLKELLKLFPINTWRKSTFKNIDKLTMGGNDIDIEKPDAEDEKFKDYSKVKDIEPFLEELRGLRAGNIYRLTLSNGGTIKLNLLENKGNSLFFEDSGLTGPAKSYNELINVELILDIDAKNVSQMVSSTSDDENVESMYTITFKRIEKGSDTEGNRAYKPIIVKNIIDIDLIGSSDKNDDKEKKSDDKKKLSDMTDAEIDDIESEDITDLVLDDPTFKDAFLSKPGFWSRLVGGKPMGILAAKKILKQHNDGDENGDKQKIIESGKEYKVQLLDKSFNKNGVSLDMMKKYPVRAVKGKYGGENTALEGLVDGVKYVFKINKRYDTKNKFRATIIIGYNTDEEYRENRTIIVTDY